jgi:glutamate racemase
MEHDLSREPGSVDSSGHPHAPHQFLATGDPDPFRRLGRRFLGPEIGTVHALCEPLQSSV